MGLETPQGTPYISDFEPLWPLGTDYPSEGDDHIRLIKEALLATFPNLTGPVDLTQDEINTGSIPSGSRMLFYQAAAPVGWTRVPDIDATYSVRVVATDADGGVSGGSDDPVLNNKVPSHLHTASGNTGAQSANHTHTFSANTGGQSVNHNHWVYMEGGQHQHNYTAPNQASINRDAGIYGTGSPGGVGAVTPANEGWHTHAANSGTESATHTHGVSGSTSGINTGHTHYFSVNTSGPHTGATGNWTPRHLDMILCERD